MSVLLEYEYEVVYTEKIAADIALVTEVWDLVHRYCLEHLFKQRAIVVTKNLSLANAVHVVEKVKLYECEPKIVKRVESFIAQNFGDALIYTSENVQFLSYEELLCLLKSEERIPDELTRFYTIMACCKRREDTAHVQLGSLLAEIRIELIDTEGITEVRRYNLPDKVSTQHHRCFN